MIKRRIGTRLRWLIAAALVTVTGGGLAVYAAQYGRAKLSGEFVDNAMNDQYSDKSLVEEYNVGEICAGETLRHIFIFKNKTRQSLRILSDSDIQVGCGCSSLTPLTTEVSPNSEAEIELLANTEGMHKAFSLTATIVWTGGDGSKLPFKMNLVGHATRPLESDANLVEFDANEIEKGVAKTVTVRGSHFFKLTDWAVVLKGSVFASDGAEMIDDRNARVTVRCNSLQDLTSASGTIKIQASVKECERNINQTHITLDIPLIARRLTDFSIQPERLYISNNLGEGSGSLLLRGKSLRPESVKAVKCTGCEVDWKASSAAGDRVVIAVTVRKSSAASTTYQALSIEIEGKGIISVPVATQ